MSTVAAINLRDIAANRPAASIAGRLFYDQTNSILQRDNGSSWDTLTLSGALSDHTHAATGSGADGGGATLSPANLNVPQSSPGTTEGRIGWDTTRHALLAYDTARARPISPIGLSPFVAAPGYNSVLAYTSTRTLAAVSGGNAGAAGSLLFSPTPFAPYDYAIWSADTATARTAEIRLFANLLGNSTSWAYIAGTAATFSFTPGAAAIQHSTTITGAGILPAGWYFVVLRNTSASQTFALGTQAAAAASALGNFASLFITTASIAALGSSIDPSTLTGASNSILGIAVRCLPDGGATPLFA